VVLAGFYPPPFAGEPIHVKQLADLLRADGLSVEILNLNRHAPPSPAYHCARSRWVLLWRLLTLAGRRSILHLHTNGHSRKSWLMILVASLAARLRATTTVLTLHSGLLPGYVAGFGAIRRRLAGWILRPFSHVVCVNGEIGRAIRGLGIPDEHSSIIPAFLGVPAPIEPTPADRALIQGFDPLLVAVAGGEEDPERGLIVVLRAVQQLAAARPAVGVVLMGWQVGPKTRAAIAELGLAGRAVCLGEVSHERCLAFFRAADVVIRSTFVDGDAITVREALALGVPVVASDTAFRPAGVTLFRRGDAADLAAGLTRVLAATSPTSPSPAAPSPARHNQPAKALRHLYSVLTGPGEETGQLAGPRGRRAAAP
jgi:glycosyltransferase involved in cell wall biosynthesis